MDEEHALSQASVGQRSMRGLKAMVVFSIPVALSLPSSPWNDRPILIQSKQCALL
jgi:hypothetical protein